MNTVHFPTSKPGTDRHPKGSGEPPSPLASPQPAPSLRTRNFRSNQQGHMTALKHRTLPEPAVTLPNGDVAPRTCTPTAPIHSVHASPDFIDPAPVLPKPEPPHARTIVTSVPTAPRTPVPVSPVEPTRIVHIDPAAVVPKPERVPGALNSPSSDAPARSPDTITAGLAKPDPFAPAPTVPPIAREPRDFSALHSGKQNPWGSIRHRHYRSHAMHGNFTQSPNPCQYSRSRPLHSRYPISPSRDSFKPPLNTLHAESMQLNPHSKLRLPVERQPPATVFQVIQHPHGISPTKPKITKTVPITSRHSPETQKPMSIARCFCGRNIIPVYNPNRSWRSAGTRRRFGRRVGTWRESWDRGRGHSHFLGGIQAWGPRFARGGYMDQLCWSGSGFGSGFGGDRR